MKPVQMFHICKHTSSFEFMQKKAKWIAKYLVFATLPSKTKIKHIINWEIYKTVSSEIAFKRTRLNKLL